LLGSAILKVKSRWFRHRTAAGTCTRLSAALIAIMVFILIGGSTRAQPTATARSAAAGAAGSITAIQGAVTIVRAGKTLTAAYGMPVQVGDQFNTGLGSQVTITLVDGTQLELAEASGLTMVADRLDANGQRAQTRIDLIRGLLHSLVRFAPGNAPNYEVHTPNAVAAARGTNYDTDYTKGVARKSSPGCLEFTDVRVFEGTVEVSNPNNPTAPPVELIRNHATSVACLLGPSAAVTTGLGTVPGAAIVGGATAVGAAGVVGGLAAAGALGGGGSASAASPTPVPISPSQ
jgi:ferric-dicitrate binding protein FerR (iron transport regulator)